ncbi:unnamed protein product [Cuscuta campestris]|uniref:Uncharacterized protein n=1 Tax=Cuscuta campestris TaxID=132261 RepID=A0A484MXB6_9ASTE|nr:unnamed protein product [Cuscuta campestris]
MLNLHAIDSHTTLAFTLFGHGNLLTVRELAVHLGLYTWEETMEQAFHDAPFILPEDVNQATFWAQHSSDLKSFDAMGLARRLGSSSSESNTASSSMPLTTGASFQPSSKRAARRCLATSRATTSTSQEEPTPEWSQRILEHQETIIRTMATMEHHQTS